ncbi:MAG: SRPBCC domain-containing protein [Allosphingosinicella sp.]
MTRAFAASPVAVFDAWLDDETAGRWLFATPDGEMVRVSIDPQVGGHFEIVERRGGEDVLHTGTYEAIEPPERLEFTLQVPKYSPSSSLVRIAIAPMEGGSQLTLSQSVPEGSPAIPDRIEHGWATVLEGLARTLEGEEG